MCIIYNTLLLAGWWVGKDWNKREGVPDFFSLSFHFIIFGTCDWLLRGKGYERGRMWQGFSGTCGLPSIEKSSGSNGKDGFPRLSAFPLTQSKCNTLTWHSPSVPRKTRASWTHPLPANGAAGTKVISVARMSCAHKYVLGSFTYKKSKFEEKLLRNFTMATAEHGTNHRPHTREVSPALSGKITVWSQFCFENHPPHTHTHILPNTGKRACTHIHSHEYTDVFKRSKRCTQKYQY